MKILIKKCLLFLSVLLPILGTTWVFNNRLIKQNQLVLGPKVKILIAGSSLVTEGINPDIIGNAVNIGDDFEPFLITYLKIKELLSKSNSVKSILLSFSFPEVFANEDAKFRDQTSSRELFQRIMFLENAPEFRYFKPFGANWFTYWEMCIKNRVLLFPAMETYRLVKKDRTPYFKGYEQTNETFAFNRREREQLFADTIRAAGYNRIARMYVGKDLVYVDSLMHLTRRNDIDLIMVGMPIHKYLYRNLSNQSKDIYRKHAKLLYDHEHVHYINLTGLLDDNSFFEDTHHLNKAGADSVSRVLSKLLREESFLYE